MKIETKFDIGQKVWRIASWKWWREFRKEGWNVVGREAVGDGVIHMSTAKGTYMTSKDEACEDDLFLTKREAQAECDRKNNA